MNVVFYCCGFTFLKRLQVFTFVNRIIAFKVMKLKLVLEQTGQSWTLKPNHEYLLGSRNDCDICILNSSIIAGYHLRFSFSRVANTWYVYDLGNSSGTFIKNQIIKDYSITAKTYIVIAGKITVIAIPEVTTAPIQLPNSPPPKSPLVPKHSQNTLNIQRLNWKQYVQKQVEKEIDWLARITTNFYLSTGLRPTPWINSDAYVIPDFLKKGNVQEVEKYIWNNISHLKLYKDTDCFVVDITDEHLIDSSKETFWQQFINFSFFPTRQGKNGTIEYKKAIIVSYNQIRSYVIIEDYGNDIFVNLITRYEGTKNSRIKTWLIISIILSIMQLPKLSLVTATFPVSVWIIVCIILPNFMKKLHILPKKANAHILILILITSYIFIALILHNILLKILNTYFN